MMRTLVLAGLFAAAWPAAQADMQAWSFRVLLDGREIGQHRFTLLGTAAQREVRSSAQFDVKVLTVPLYRYRHEAVEQWVGNCLQSLTSRTETNGAREEVRATARGDGLVVEGAGASREHAGCLMTFAYWDPQILAARRLLNSQTGELVPVNVTSHGEQTLTVLGQPKSARHYRISASRLQIDLWYAGNQWVALEAITEGGKPLRYERM
jgi:Family of unknown function (DUF6134)